SHRPSGGHSDRDQRKDYGQTLLKPQNDFQHHVEHLLTMHLERDLRSAEDCLWRLRELEEQGRIWGQDVILAVRDQELVLSDVESKEELEAFPLDNVQGCSTGLDNTVLAISVQERSPPRTSVLLFQCERLGTAPLCPQASLPKVVVSLAMGSPCGPTWPQCPSKSPCLWALSPSSGVGGGPFSPPGSAPPSHCTPRTQPLTPSTVPHSGSQPPKCVRQAGITLTPPSGGCLGGLLHPGPPQVLAHSPSPGLAAAVESPLLLREALEFLEENLSDDDYGVWKSLGTAWNKSRCGPVPAYIPVFSDGWLPPVMEQERHGGLQDTPPPASVSPTHFRHPSLSLPPAQSPAAGWRDTLYDFQARNSQELSVRKGDMLQVLDQQRKWWLVQDERGDRGHVPGNILEPLPEPGYSPRQVGVPSDSPPTLEPDSSPAEVTAWLMDKGFSRITVRTLGVLPGHELLQMSPAELRAVCPEEWRRVLFKLSPTHRHRSPPLLRRSAPGTESPRPR
uniref:EPS8 like 3 n=1 Tax=Cyanoderma ruficeps TaxID=181631 RepID=A0A8C3RD99_9PASS